MTPSQRSLALLKAEGFQTAVVERWNPHARIRQDLFGFADLIAVQPGFVPRLVQVTSGSNVSARVSKILEEPRALACLMGGFEIIVHGWRKVKVKRGGKAMRWAPRIVPVNAEDFNLCLYPRQAHSPGLQALSTQSPPPPA